MPLIPDVAVAWPFGGLSLLVAIGVAFRVFTGFTR